MLVRPSVGSSVGSSATGHRSTTERPSVGCPERPQPPTGVLQDDPLLAVPRDYSRPQEHYRATLCCLSRETTAGHRSTTGRPSAGCPERPPKPATGALQGDPLLAVPRDHSRPQEYYRATLCWLSRETTAGHRSTTGRPSVGCPERPQPATGVLQDDPLLAVPRDHSRPQEHCRAALCWLF